MNLRKTRAIMVCLLLVALPAASYSQVPRMMSYQGRMTIGGTNYDGTGYFKFALVDAAGNGFWSNDGNGPPQQIVTLPVSKGAYSVMLGNTNIPGMTMTVPGWVFDNSDVRLRIWFGPDTNSVQQLSPDQRIATVGYAFRAGKAYSVNPELSADYFRLQTSGGDHGGLQFSMGNDGVITLGTPGGAGLVLQGDENLERAISLGLPNGSSLWMQENGDVHLSGNNSIEVACNDGHLRVTSNGVVAIETSADIALFGGNNTRVVIGNGSITMDVTNAGGHAIEIDANSGWPGVKAPGLVFIQNLGVNKIFGNVALVNGGMNIASNLWVGGDIIVAGEKHFVQAHPLDRSKEIVYTSLEGPEAGTYVRGAAELVNGEAVITLPDHFGMVTSTNGLTVQLTPRGKWLQLYVAEVSVARITVREAEGRSGKFDYLVQGVRLGYENSPVIRDRHK